MKLLHEVLPLERTLIGLDLETTSNDPKQARIVQVGLEIMKPDGSVKEWSALVNPGGPIPPEATAVHGITDEAVAAAPPFGYFANNLLTGFYDSDVAGYNVRYDLEVIAAEFGRLGLKWSFENVRMLDAYRLWQVIEGRALTDAVERWIRIDGDAAESEFLGSKQAHDATWDVKASTRSLAGQLHLRPELPRSVQALHDLCFGDLVDVTGKFKWKDGVVVFAFGEHRGRPLQAVPTRYLRWMLGRDFSEEVKRICENAINGNYPKR